MSTCFIDLKHTPSYMLGNLTLSPSYMAYLYSSDNVYLVVKSLSVNKTTLIDLGKQTNVSQFAYVCLKDTWYLVVLTSHEGVGQVSVYSENGLNKLALETHGSKGVYRGVSVYSDTAILLGNTLGTLHLLTN